jgi:hypothetical protein
MAMRTECRHFESRTYANGDAMRRCRLDLAPDAPWRCPDQCPKFEHRAVDIGWAHGSVVPTATATEPESVKDGTAASVLGEAEAIINAMAEDIAAELKEKKNKKKKHKRK